MTDDSFLKNDMKQKRVPPYKESPINLNTSAAPYFSRKCHGGKVRYYK